MLNVEFVYDRDCPNIEATRSHLMKAFSRAKLQAKWKEWDRNSSETPNYARKHGSPTILVNGNDIMGIEPETNANCCRIYNGKGVPDIDLIVNRLLASNKETEKNSHLMGVVGTFSIGPGVSSAFLAKASCPLCYPAIAAFFSSIGLGFLFKGIYFYIMMTFFLSIALIGLAFKAKERRGYGPLIIGVIGAFFAVIFHYLNNQSLFYLGVGILVVASLWNLIPDKKKCRACN